MDWMTKLQKLKLWHSQSELRQKAMMKDYLNLYPGISSSAEWLLCLARMFGVGRLEAGYLDLESVVY